MRIVVQLAFGLALGISVNLSYNFGSRISPRKLIMAKAFPVVQPGGSLILAWQIKGKKVLVVGGGDVRFP